MNKNGFTLMELLIVISIVGILSAIVIPAVFSGSGDWGQRGQFCRNGVLWNRDINGSEVQVVGGNGYPMTCQ